MDEPVVIIDMYNGGISRMREILYILYMLDVLDYDNYKEYNNKSYQRWMTQPIDFVQRSK